MMKVTVLLLCFSIGWLVTEAALSCDNYNPDVCFPDLRKYCLTNTTVVVGTCSAQQAVCREGAKEATELGCCDGTVQCVPLNSASLPTPVFFWIISAIVCQFCRHVGF